MTKPLFFCIFAKFLMLAVRVLCLKFNWLPQTQKIEIRLCAGLRRSLTYCLVIQISHALFRCSCWHIFVIFRRRFRSLTTFAAEWCALSAKEGGKRWAAGKTSRSQKSYNRRPSFSPFAPKRCAPFRKARSTAAESPPFNNKLPENNMDGA